jgi:DnaJ-class molecular chaperone
MGDLWVEFDVEFPVSLDLQQKRQIRAALTQ